ncbi:L-rhamnono-gamma-lactonase [Escovopsis weberi]|uniref:L-rhamnono-gamma-lactonase n=1 Tax=Escovopsis weberi TaxID=150374 RepID=A0A0M9VUT3_ESCWE|nr:L-rhamnono-gamma-lactonase [Escovopsis weberi]
MAEDRLLLPIIDSHVHIYPQSEVPDLAWCTPEHPLASQHSLDQYKQTTRTAPSLLGFVFVETERRHDLAAGPSGAGWDGPLREVRWLRRVALGEPLDGEGHAAPDARLCLGIVPWAPVPSGPDALEQYLARVRDEAGDAWPKIRGFRYLLQDAPHGTMLQQPFIDSLKLLGRSGFSFEVAVDQHRRGKRQLEEVLEMIGRAHDGVPEDERVTFILNHLCKPDMTLYNVTSDPSFTAWRTAMYALGKSSKTYIKLSGAFSEMTPAMRAQDPSAIFQSLLAWLGIVLATFGSRRIMFGSDWPVCTVGFEGTHEGKDAAWPKWREVVEKMCWMASLDDEERAMIFGGTAKEAYRL